MNKMKQATHFIEQINYDDNIVRHVTIQPISMLTLSNKITEKFKVNVVAIFKIIPKGYK